MNNYIGVKIIKAEPKTYGEYRKIKYGSKSDFTPSIEDNAPGYLVIYPNPTPPNHMSWSPKEVFEMAYREIIDFEVNLMNDDINL